METGRGALLDGKVAEGFQALPELRTAGQRNFVSSTADSTDASRGKPMPWHRRSRGKPGRQQPNMKGAQSSTVRDSGPQKFPQHKMREWNDRAITMLIGADKDRMDIVVMSRAGQYRQLARDFHLMARDLPPGENRSMLLNMAEECDRLADQQEQATDLRQERSKRARKRETRLAEKPIHERLHENDQK